MVYKRIIARLDVKGQNVIKGIQMDGLRVVGPVHQIAERRYHEGADEIILIDTVATLYGRPSLEGLLKGVTSSCFVPVTVGGGVRSVADADVIFAAGADKVAVNTGAIQNPRLLKEIADKYGNQAVVVHIEAKFNAELTWECFTHGGREPSGLSVVRWLAIAQQHGIGELLISNVDRDGTRRGIDLDLVRLVRNNVDVPVVASSGIGQPAQLVDVFSATDCDGVAIGAGLHWTDWQVSDYRDACLAAGVGVRGGG